jgi:hypothetical protein
MNIIRTLKFHKLTLYINQNHNVAYIYSHYLCAIQSEIITLYKLYKFYFVCNTNYLYHYDSSIAVLRLRYLSIYGRDRYVSKQDMSNWVCAIAAAFWLYCLSYESQHCIILAQTSVGVPLMSEVSPHPV